MADEQLRMRAVVEDGYTAPLAKLRSALRETSGVKALREMGSDLRGVNRELGGVVNGFRFGLAPLMRSVGVASLGAIGSIGGVMYALKGVAGYGRDLKYTASQLEMSVQKLRELQNLGQYFDVPAEQTTAALKTLQDNLNQLVHNWGTAYNELRARNLGVIADDLVKAAKEGGVGKAFDVLLNDIKTKIKNPARQREIARLLLGGDQFVPMAREMTDKIAKMAKENSIIDPDFTKKSEKFIDDLKRIEQQLDKMKVEYGGPLLSGVTRVLDDIDAAMKTVAADYEKFKSGDWKGLMAPDPGQQRRSLQRQLDAAKHRLESLDDGITQNSRSGAGGTGYAEIERRRLIEEIEKLRKALEDANRGALLQKQSFMGGGFGSGAGVIPASLRSGLPPVIGPRSATRTPPMGEGHAIPDDAGAGLRSSAYLAARRAGMKAEVDNDPLLRRQIAGMLTLEGTPVQTMEALANRTEYVNADRRRRGLAPLSLRQMLFSGFYGPINRGQLPSAMRRLQGDPKLMKRMQSAIDAVLAAGSNTVEGATDQGMPSDPNGRWAGGGFRLRKGGNVFNDWGGGPGGHAGAQRFREEQQSHVRDGGAVAGMPIPRPAPPEIRGSASIDINFNGLPSGTRIRHQFDGMFRDINIRRGRPMQSVWDRDV